MMILFGEKILQVTAELEFQKKYILQLKLLYIKMNADGHKMEWPLNVKQWTLFQWNTIWKFLSPFNIPNDGWAEGPVSVPTLWFYDSDSDDLVVFSLLFSGSMLHANSLSSFEHHKSSYMT